MPVTSRLDRNAARFVQAGGGQQRVERVFRGLKDGSWLGRGPPHLRTKKIRVHAFTRTPGVSLPQSLHRRASAAWPGLATEELKQCPDGIRQFDLPGPCPGGTGLRRAETVSSKQALVQRSLAQAADLEELTGSLGKPRGQYLKAQPKYCGINSMPVRQWRSQYSAAGLGRAGVTVAHEGLLLYGCHTCVDANREVYRGGAFDSDDGGQAPSRRVADHCAAEQLGLPSRKHLRNLDDN